jgi:hypothetical protein
MAITNLDQLVNALGNNSSRLIIDKGNLANQLAGVYCSMWRATGQPAQGAIPTAAAVCTNATTGAMGFAQQTAPVTSYLGVLDVVGSNAAFTLEIHDRIAHMGGLVLNSTTSQTTNLPINLDTLAPSADRIGSADFGDVQWWLEVYGDGGATASNATINVTFNDNTSGNLNTQAVGGTIRVGRRYSVDALRTGAQQGKNIKAINSVILSASTGTAGNFGFTCTRPRAYLPMGLANFVNKLDWAAAGLPEIPNGSCLELMVLPSTTSSGTLRGGGKIIHG